jgi:outer membrane protein OmpA-like peptidoglycan-associated protein
MVKAVTSPLSLLSSMLGSGEDFSAVQFGYGTSVIPPGEEQKLSGLSRALLDRPALKVELKGYDDDVFKAPEKESTSRSRVELNAIAQ